MYPGLDSAHSVWAYCAGRTRGMLPSAIYGGLQLILVVNRSKFVASVDSAKQNRPVRLGIYIHGRCLSCRPSLPLGVARSCLVVYIYGRNSCICTDGREIGPDFCVSPQIAASGVQSRPVRAAIKTFPRANTRSGGNAGEANPRKWKLSCE